MNEVGQAIRCLDVSIYRSLGLFAGNPLLDRLANHEEGNNLVKGGLFLAIFWYLWFRTSSDQEKRRRSIVALLIGAILAIVVARTVAFIAPFRFRPIYDPTLTHFWYSIPLTPNLENWSSFPSDTAAYFFALAFGIGYLSRRLAMPVMLYTAAWICLPRMYLGLHYASDVVAGGVIGISAAWLSLKSDFLQSVVSRRVLAELETRPQWFHAVAFLVSLEMATVFDGLRNAGRAVLHAALLALHVPYRHSSVNRPIDVWGGLLVIAALVSAGYLTLAFYRKFHNATVKRTNHKADREGWYLSEIQLPREVSGTASARNNHN